jgi:hypothetical protein
VFKKLARLVGGSQPPRLSSHLYSQAVKESDDLIERLRELSAADDPVCQLFADMWQFRKNTPVITTLYEANQEMMSAVKQR